jgi:hypothetical protein
MEAAVGIGFGALGVLLAMLQLWVSWPSNRPATSALPARRRRRVIVTIDDEDEDLRRR